MAPEAGRTRRRPTPPQVRERVRAPAPPGQYVDRRTLRKRHLGGQVRRSAEAVDAELATGWQRRPSKRSIADDAGAQERRQLVVRIARRQRVGVSRWDDRVLGVSAVGVPAGVAGERTQVLGIPPAVPASTTGPAQPGDADSLPWLEAGDVVGRRHHPPDDLVSGNDIRRLGREISLGEMEVGSAHGTHQDADQDLAGIRLRHRQCRPAQRMAVGGFGLVDDPRGHLRWQVFPHRHGMQHRIISTGERHSIR
jgi:hypothetical protein